jgi:hypothetical protein
MNHAEALPVDGLVGPDGGRFIEVDDAAGHSISCRTRLQGPDGNWVLHATLHPLRRKS